MNSQLLVIPLALLVITLILFVSFIIYLGRS
jgi:hypothetical protein